MTDPALGTRFVYAKSRRRNGQSVRPDDPASLITVFAGLRMYDINCTTIQMI